MQFKERVTGSASLVTPSTLVMTRLWFIAVLTCVVVVACERVPLTAPTSSTISVTVDQTTLPLNGQATVRAIVIESGGTPVHNGTQVVFSTTLGSFTPVEANTINGVATSVFSAGSISGTTAINAYSGGASTGSGNSSGGGVEVKIGAAARGQHCGERDAAIACRRAAAPSRFRRSCSTRRAILCRACTVLFIVDRPAR